MSRLSRDMNRTLRHLLVAFALVFAQQAAQLHALSHVKRDLAMAGCGGKCIPPASHPAEQCIAYHAVDSTLPGLAPAIDPPHAAVTAFAAVVVPLLYPPRIEFDSRAPPYLS
jgi:hypothetical protein